MASQRISITRKLSKIIAAVTLAVTAGLFSLPADAQFFPFDDRFFGPSQRQHREYRAPRAPVEEQDHSRAPAAKPPEVQPSVKILVLGDSLADWLAYGLEDQLAETPEIGILRKHRAYSGLIRYETRSDVEWAKVARDLIAAEKPQAIVMLLGVHDRQAIRDRVQPAKPAPQKPGTPAAQQNAQTGAQQSQDAQSNDDETPAVAAPEPQRAKPTGPFEFKSEKWEELYGARIDETIAALKSANVPVLWVGLPSVRGARSTGDVQYLNELYRARAEKAGILYVDVWDGFVDERNNFVVRGPDVEGQIRQLRSGDGVHFTRFGARKLAHYVERDLRRVLREPIPVALTTPADTTPAQTGKPAAPAATSRPLAGPVLLLGSPLNEPEELLGGGPAKSATLDPLATRMLVRGEPTRTEPGRADDFSWPPRLPNLVATEPLPPTGAPLAIVRAAPKPVPVAQQAGAPAPAGPRVAAQGQARPQRQEAPTFWRRQAPQYYGPARGFFGLFR